MRPDPNERDPRFLAHRFARPDTGTMTALDDLHAAGIDVDHVQDLRSRPDVYRRAVPIVAAWLTRIDDPAEAQWTVRVLASRWAKPAFDTLVDALLLYAARARAGGSDAVGWGDAAWAAGNAIEVVWNDSRFDDLAAFVQDGANGAMRQMVVYGMRKSKRPEAPAIATALLADDEVAQHAIAVLLKHPIERARPGLEALLDTPGVRVKARAVLERMDERAR